MSWATKKQDYSLFYHASSSLPMIPSNNKIYLACFQWAVHDQFQNNENFMNACSRLVPVDFNRDRVWSGMLLAVYSVVPCYGGSLGFGKMSLIIWSMHSWKHANKRRQINGEHAVCDVQYLAWSGQSLGQLDGYIFLC